MATPETLPMHPVRELQEWCQQLAEGLTRNGNLATFEVFIDGVQVVVAQNPQKKMAQKLAARNALAALKSKETAEAKQKADEDGKKKNGSQTFTRQTLNDICLGRNWSMPLYRCICIMDKSWINSDRISNTYRDGVKNFIVMSS